jgi:hypothetical protein
MNNLNKNIAITALLSTSYLFSGVAMAAEGTSNEDGSDVTDLSLTGGQTNNINEDDEITLSFNQPQSLAVSAPNNEVNRAAGGIINKTWHVVSNNAVAVRFTGKSPTDIGGNTNVPTFYKAEVDASGDKIETADGSGIYHYDHLVTTYGVSIAGQGSVAGVKTAFEGGTSPAGTPTELVKDLDAASGPDAHFGSIMPSDDGRFTMTLSAKGVGDVATTQSGDYQVTIVASFVAEEKGNNTITASTTDGLLTTIDTYDAITSVVDDNSGFQDTSATGVVVFTDDGSDATTTGGVELSPEVLSDDTTGADDTAASNATEY